MSHNGDRRDRYMSPDRRRYSPDESERRREYEWNQYVAQGSPSRSADMDYPRQDIDRRRGSDDSRGRYRDRSPIRCDDRSYRSSPHRELEEYKRDRFDRDRRDDRRRSPPGGGRDGWSRDACPTVVVKRVPPSIGEEEIREEVDRFGAPSLSVRIEYDQGPNDANERICIIEFEGTRDAISWMTQHQGALHIGRERLVMNYFDPTFSREDRRRARRDSRERDYYGDHEFRDDYRRHYSGPPTDTMIVKGLDRDSTESSVRSSFEYITHFPIVDIRLVRDKFGVSRGFCFVQWKSVDECKQVLDYLATATPRFHIDGKHVALEYSTPQGGGRKPRGPAQSSSNASISAAVQAAEAAIQAAQWSQNKNSGNSKQEPPKPTPVTVSKPPEKPQPAAMKVPTPAAAKPAQAPPAPVTAAPPPALQPGQYPPPIMANFSFDQTSGYYYDSTTGLYYDANTRYFYNSYTAQYLYYDPSKKIYVPVSNDAQGKDKDKKDKEQQKEQKKISAKKIAKDMERWAKAQNKKKEEFKKLMEDNTGGVSGQAGGRKESSTADTVFMMLEKQSSEADRQAAVSAVYKDEFFKTPDKPAAKRGAGGEQSGLVSYVNNSDESDGDDDEEEKLIDWNKLACMLCRRGFASKEMLTKHIDMSDLHKQNLEQRRKSKVGTLTKRPSGEAVATQVKYRDRAAERRKNFGITEPPIRNRNRGMEAPVPYEQPTKDGLDDTNVGNRMLQRMGWKAGSGLGKSQSGITAPIQVQQRSRGAGLGLRGSTYGLDGSEGDYRVAAKKVTMMRYMETD